MFEGIAEVHEDDKEPEGRSPWEVPSEGLPSTPSGDWPRPAMPAPRGQTLPVQVESCNLGVVSLEVNEIEEVLGRLLISLLSEKKEGIRPWTQTSVGSPTRQPVSMTRGTGKQPL